MIAQNFAWLFFGLTIPVVVFASWELDFDDDYYLATRVAWTPVDTPSGVRTLCWLSALDTNTVTASEGAVTAWADKSGNGLNYTSIVGTPATGGEINGRPALDFTGDQMDTTSNPFGAVISNAFVICAYKVDAVANGALFSISGSITPRWQAHAPWGSGNVIFDCGGVNLITNRITTPYGVSTGTVVVTSFYGSVAENKREIYKNGVLFASASPCVPSTLSTNIMSIGGSGGQYQNATIGEYIVVDGVVDEALRQKFEGYLFPRWGVALPNGHPYKNSPPTK